MKERVKYISLLIWLCCSSIQSWVRLSCRSLRCSSRRGTQTWRFPTSVRGSLTSTVQTEGTFLSVSRSPVY